MAQKHKYHMKANATFFLNNIITQEFISATNPGFDMWHHKCIVHSVKITQTICNLQAFYMQFPRHSKGNLTWYCNLFWILNFHIFIYLISKSHHIHGI